MGVVSALGSVVPAFADESRGPAYDISWPQCPTNIPPGDFQLAVIGLNNGRPFTNNGCFWVQYEWARKAERHPDVYINLDFPRAGRKEALTGPYGRCEETDDWCRGYNWGYNLAKDAVWRTRLWSITPGRYWFDVEVDNHWSDSTRNNAQVVRGAMDYFLDFNLPVGIYGTRYQWGLITGGMEVPGRVPLWVAGAPDAASAAARCDNSSLAFAGGAIWMTQYYPEGVWDGNVVCERADRTANMAGQSRPAPEESVVVQALRRREPPASEQESPPAAATTAAADTATPTGPPAPFETYVEGAWTGVPRVYRILMWIGPG